MSLRLMLGVLLLFAVLSSLRGVASAGDPRPNILLYVVDTLRADAVAAYGNRIVDTPVLDRLAREGARFQNAIAQSSWTRPSIASILSSTSPGVHGAEGRHDLLAGGVVLLSEVLREHGYATACITTNPNVASFFGFNQGYDHFVELYGRREVGFVRPKELVTKSPVVTHAAIDWLRNIEQPFFLFVLTIDPHFPYRPPESFDRYREAVSASTQDGLPAAERLRRVRMRASYYGEIAANDFQLGRVLDHLRARAELDDTIVVFTSDHGEEFWDHGQHGHGKTLFDEVLRVPLIIRFPGRVPADERYPAGVELLDIFPTVLRLAGLPAVDGIEGRALFDGGELVPAAARPSRSSVALHDQYQVSLRQPPWKLIWNETTDEMQLFDLEREPDERRNVASEHVDVARKLFASMQRRAAADREQRARIHAGRVPPRTDSSSLPDQEREALKALGYIDREETGASSPSGLEQRPAGEQRDAPPRD